MKVTVNFPNRPQGSKVEVPGLGLFVNGETTEIDRQGEDIVIPQPRQQRQEEVVTTQQSVPTQTRQVPPTPVNESDDKETQ